MSRPTSTETQVAVMPLRFSDDVDRMRDFLTLLGFAQRVSRDARWITMAGESGMVALHAAAISTSSRSGDTGLSFEVADIGVLADRFAATGRRVEIHDESYGRVLTVIGPGGGRQITFDERPQDLYGYRLDESRPQHGIESMPIRTDSPTGPFSDLLAAAGFTRLDEGDDARWRVWRRSGGGLVGLQAPGEGRARGSVRLAVRTREPLSDLAARLAGAGHRQVPRSGDAGELAVVDPDGQTVLIQSVRAG